jgi:type I restriction enzyme S subunit
VLISITGDVGLLGLIPAGFGEAYINQHTCVVRPMDDLQGRFLPELFRSPFAQDQFNAPQRGIKNSFRLTDVTEFLVPLPPLAEQNRIVAKVDELMALCDRLEAARAQREAARDRLARSCLSRLDTPDPETFREDARFALDALPALAARPDQIKRLRQTILNLAVRGRLVPQDSSDQSASDLLIRIANDKAPTAVNRGKPGRDKSAVLPKGAWPFMPPAGWAWVAFGDIVKSRDGDRIPVSREERNGRAKVYDYYGASGVIDKIDRYLFDKPLLLIGEDGANLINRSTPIAFIARGKYWVNNHAHVLGALSEEMLRYLELFINATDLIPYITGTAQPKMNQAKMNSIPIALPPLAEQSRIVAKVDELMALCDCLEASLQQADEHRRRLLEALLHQALEPAAALEEQVA